MHERAATERDRLAGDQGPPAHGTHRSRGFRPPRARPLGLGTDRLGFHPQDTARVAHAPVLLEDRVRCARRRPGAADLDLVALPEVAANRCREIAAASGAVPVGMELEEVVPEPAGSAPGDRVVAVDQQAALRRQITTLRAALRSTPGGTFPGIAWSFLQPVARA